MHKTVLLKTRDPLPLSLGKVQSKSGARANFEPRASAKGFQSASFHHDGPNNGLHLVQRGMADPHIESGAFPPQRSRLGKAMDAMLGRADVRSPRSNVRQSWRA